MRGKKLAPKRGRVPNFEKYTLGRADMEIENRRSKRTEVQFHENEERNGFKIQGVLGKRLRTPLLLTEQIWVPAGWQGG